MKTLFLALLVLLGASPCVAAETSWKEFSSAEGGFAALMPEEPTTTITRVFTRKGALDTHITSSSDLELNEYLVSWTEYPQDDIEQRATEENFRRMRDALVAYKKGKVLSETTFTLEGHPARALVFETDDDRVTRVRFYHVGKRIYQVMTVTKNGRKYAEDSERFLNSFRLLPGRVV